MISTPRPFRRRQSGARRVAVRPESCETRTLLSASELGTEIKVAQDDVPVEEVVESTEAGAGCDGELVICDEYVVDPLAEDVPFDPSEFIRFMSFAMSSVDDQPIEFKGEDASGEWPGMTTDGPVAHEVYDDPVSVELYDDPVPVGYYDDPVPLDEWANEIAPEGWQPEWAWRTLIGPAGDVVDESRTGEPIDGEPAAGGPEFDIEYFDISTLEDWDPSWSYRDFTFGGDPLSEGDEGELAWATSGPGVSEDGTEWNPELVWCVMEEGPGTDGELFEITAEEAPDFSELTPEEQELIRNFFGVALELFSQTGETPADSDPILMPCDPLPEELWTFGGEAVGDDGVTDDRERPLDEDWVEITGVTDDFASLYDGEPESTPNEELAWMSFLPLAAATGGADVQHGGVASDSSSEPEVLPRSFAQPLSSPGSRLFSNSSESSRVAAATADRVASPLAALPAATRPNSASRSRSAVRTSSISKATTVIEFGLSPLFESADDAPQQNVRPADEDAAPQPDDAEVSESRSAPGAADQHQADVMPPQPRRVASRQRAVSIDQFMTQFAQDSFMA